MDQIKISFSESEAAELKKFVTDGRSYADRVSIALTMQLLGMKGSSAELPYILAAMDAVEGIRSGSRSKGAKRLQRPLNDFWHKHFFAPRRHLLKNLGAEYGLDNEGNQRLDRLIHEVAKEFGDQPGVWQGVLAHRLGVEGFHNRSRRIALTGDWIVFGKHSGQNYYLALATHEEGRGQPAVALLERSEERRV